MPVLWRVVTLSHEVWRELAVWGRNVKLRFLQLTVLCVEPIQKYRRYIWTSVSDGQCFLTFQELSFRDNITIKHSIQIIKNYYLGLNVYPKVNAIDTTAVNYTVCEYLCCGVTSEKLDYTDVCCYSLNYKWFNLPWAVSGVCSGTTSKRT